MQVSRITQLINEHYKEGVEKKELLEFKIYGHEYAIMYDNNEYFLCNIFRTDNDIRINIFTQGMTYINLKSYIQNYFRILEKDLTYNSKKEII